MRRQTHRLWAEGELTVLDLTDERTTCVGGLGYVSVYPYIWVHLRSGRMEGSKSGCLFKPLLGELLRLTMQSC